MAKEGRTILCKEIAEEGYSHAERLHVFIEEIIKEAGITFQDLSAIAVSQGPGSYTGLRIGVSAAKGLCYALEIPLIAVDTLQVLASQANVSDGLIIPMLDARRMEVYSAIFTPNFDKKKSRSSRDYHGKLFRKFTGNPLFSRRLHREMQAGFDQGKLHFFGRHQISFRKRNEFFKFRKIQKKRHC